MDEPPTPAPTPSPAPPATRPGSPPRAVVQTKASRPFQLIWLIPVVAAFIAAYLLYQTVANSGPDITISFQAADGITGGQTKVRHKAVDLGTVRTVRLSPDMNSVEIHVAMTREAARTLTADARFWVVRPRLTAGNISGLDTVLSGSYIEMDPGAGNGPRKTEFVGLEDPPAVRSGEAGVPIVLTADRIGSIQPGAPVFYRDIPAGEVSSFQLGPHGDGVTIHAFVRAPYDRFVHRDTHFWNASGVAVSLGAQGIQLRVASLQAVLSGGVAFDTPGPIDASPNATPDSRFRLFGSEADAEAAGYSTQIKLVTYFQGSVRGLAVDAPVELYGIQIGTVTGIKLDLDPTGASSRVEVHMQVQPERFMHHPDTARADHLAVAQRMVARGLRAELQSANLLTGQQLIAFDFEPAQAPAQAVASGDEIEVPSTSGSFDSITSNLAQVAQKLRSLPLDQIANNLNTALHGVSEIVAGPEIHQSLQSLNGTLNTAQEVLRRLDSGSAPLLNRLPAIAQALQLAADRAAHLVGSTDTGYGANSEFSRNLDRLLAEASDTARSVRLLADYLDQHPEALIRGRAGR